MFVHCVCSCPGVLIVVSSSKGYSNLIKKPPKIIIPNIYPGHHKSYIQLPTPGTQQIVRHGSNQTPLRYQQHG
jgi:hypothetical protein